MSKNFTFKHAIKYRALGFWFALLAVTYRAIFNDIWGTLIIGAISLYCDFQYKCPHCNKTFEIRANPKRLEYCPNCGKKLNISDEK